MVETLTNGAIVETLNSHAANPSVMGGVKFPLRWRHAAGLLQSIEMVQLVTARAGVLAPDAHDFMALPDLVPGSPSAEMDSGSMRENFEKSASPREPDGASWPGLSISCV